MLALSSMSRRSLYVGLTWVGLFLVGWTVAGVLGTIHHRDVRLSMMQKQAELSRARVNDGPPGKVQGRPDPPQRSNENENEFDQAAEDENARKAPLPQSRPDAKGIDAGPATALDADPRASRAGGEEDREDRLAAACFPTRPISIASARRSSAPMPPGFKSAVPSSSDGPESWRCPRPWMNSNNLQPADERGLAEARVPQYPWTWSAAVLAGLWGLSLCILSTRVKSLDRLR